MKNTIRTKRWGDTSLYEYFNRDYKQTETKASFTPYKVLTKDDFFQLSALKNTKDRVEFETCLINPEKGWKLMWDTIGMCIIFYQAITIPYILAFEVENLYIWSVFDVLITVFFICDIFLNFHTAFYKRGDLITSKKEICMNYIKTWFLIDLVATFPITTVITLVNGGSIFSPMQFSSTAYLLKAFRLSRILKLLRLAKLKNHIIELESYISNNTITNIIIFLRLVLSSVFVAHWIACLWYYIAREESTDSPNIWIRLINIQDKPPYEIYINSLYFAFTTMATVGYGDITPGTNIEIIFVIICEAVACVQFTYAIGRLSGIFSQHSADSTIYRTRAVALNSYLKRKKLPHDLRSRVRRYIDFVWESQKAEKFGEDEILNMLSEPLREEILVYARGQLFQSCKIFHKFNKSFSLSLSKLVEVRSFAPYDTIFKEGEISLDAIFIRNGQVEIFHNNTNSTFMILNNGDYFGEIAFFIRKPRTASARCTSFVETLCISRDQIECLIDKMPDVRKTLSDIEESCKNNDFTELGISCYLCKEIGHVAINCSKSVLNLENHKGKERWLNERNGDSKFINPKLCANKHHLRSGRIHRSIVPTKVDTEDYQEIQSKLRKTVYRYNHFIKEEDLPLCELYDSDILNQQILGIIEESELENEYEDSDVYDFEIKHKLSLYSHPANLSDLRLYELPQLEPRNTII